MARLGRSQPFKPIVKAALVAPAVPTVSIAAISAGASQVLSGNAS